VRGLRITAEGSEGGGFDRWIRQSMLTIEALQDDEPFRWVRARLKGRCRYIVLLTCRLTLLGILTPPQYYLYDPGEFVFSAI